MKRFFLTWAALLCSLLLALPACAQEAGYWRAASKTARSITGDVAFSPASERFSINFLAYPIAQIRTLKPAELGAAFDADVNTPGLGNLFRIDIPGTTKFLHKNTLCGGDDAQWMATYVAGKDLQVAFFSGATMPVFTLEALGNSTNLCGTFTYTR
jgi:hypothetical protein